jgi:hypothetical protein
MLGIFRLYRNPPITDKVFQMIYECEEERMVFKACMRNVLSLKKSDKHTSWHTAEVSSLYLT